MPRQASASAETHDSRGGGVKWWEHHFRAIQNALQISLTLIHLFPKATPDHFNLTQLAYTKHFVLSLQDKSLGTGKEIIVYTVG